VIRVQGQTFEILEDYRNSWNMDTFKERYSEVLSKFDYIVGDWGYGQLRLKGFFEDNHPKSSFDNRISFFDEYIQEYCNFGCPFFLLRRVKVKDPRLITKEAEEE
jgi:uncharacterized protein YutD